jgi:hypothetical protein
MSVQGVPFKTNPDCTGICTFADDVNSVTRQICYLLIFTCRNLHNHFTADNKSVNHHLEDKFLPFLMCSFDVSVFLWVSALNSLFSYVFQLLQTSGVIRIYCTCIGDYDAGLDW